MNLTYQRRHFTLVTMSKRLQVILDDKEMSAIQHIAKERRMTVAEWARQALRAARRHVPVTDAQKKFEVIRSAVRHDFPTGDIDQILREINQGYPVSSSL